MRAINSIEGVRYLSTLAEAEQGVPFALITNTHTKPEKLPKSALQNTVLLIHPNSGHDNFSDDFLANAGFPVVVGNCVRANAVAEYVLSCLFHHFTPVPNHAYWSETREWDRKLLRDQTVLILGMGRVGKLLFQALTPLCANVEGVDPFVQGPFNPGARQNLNLESLAQTNILIVAASLTPSSRRLIDKDALKRLPSDALLINAARGEIVNEKDLADWLKRSPKARAWLDVFEKEPFAPGHLGELANLNKTSHIAGVYKGLNKDIVTFEKDIIEDFCRRSGSGGEAEFVTAHKELILNLKERIQKNIRKK